MKTTTKTGKLGAALCSALAIGSVVTAAYADEDNGFRAISACHEAMGYQPDPATADDRKYNDYVLNRDAAFAKNPALKASTAKPQPAGKTYAEEFVACEKYFNDYASGVGAAKMSVSQKCKSEVGTGLGTAKAANLGTASLDGPKMCRLGVEIARGKLTRNKEGRLTALYDACYANDRFKLGFADLQAQVTEADAACVKIETKAGLKFAGLRSTRSSSGEEGRLESYTVLEAQGKCPVTKDFCDKPHTMQEVETELRTHPSQASAAPAAGNHPIPKTCSGKTGFGPIAITDSGSKVEMRADQAQLQAVCTRTGPLALECDYTQNGKAMGKSTVRIQDISQNMGMGLTGRIGQNGREWLCLAK